MSIGSPVGDEARRGCSDGGADDQAGQFGDRDGARIGSRDGLAAAHHRDPVGVGDHLAELVGDEHDGGAAGGDAAHRRQKPLRLLVGEHGGRLVEDEDAGAADEHLEDLDPLLLGDRQLVDRLSRIDLEAELVALAVGPRRSISRRPRREAAARIGEQDVLERVERPHQLEVLMHHADAASLGVERPADAPPASPLTQIWPSSGV